MKYRHTVPSSTSQVHERPECDTHGHFCRIFGNIATLTNSSTLISKIIVAKLNYCVKVVFDRAFDNEVTVQIRSFLFFHSFKFNRSRNSFKAFLVHAKDDSGNF